MVWLAVVFVRPAREGSLFLVVEAAAARSVVGVVLAVSVHQEGEEGEGPLGQPAAHARPLGRAREGEKVAERVQLDHAARSEGIEAAAHEQRLVLRLVVPIQLVVRVLQDDPLELAPAVHLAWLEARAGSCPLQPETASGSPSHSPAPTDREKRPLSTPPRCPGDGAHGDLERTCAHGGE